MFDVLTKFHPHNSLKPYQKRDFSVQNNCKPPISFKGQLAKLDKYCSVITKPVNENYLTTIEGQTEWLKWISLRLKQFKKNNCLKRPTDSVKQLFETIKLMFESGNSDKIIDNAYKNNQLKMADNYLKTGTKVINQFRLLGLPPQDCQKLKDRLYMYDNIYNTEFTYMDKFS